MYGYFLLELPMLPIPNRIWSRFWWPAEDALYRTYYQMGWQIPGATAQDLVIAIWLKIEDRIKRGRDFNFDKIATSIFCLLRDDFSRPEDRIYFRWTWRMARTIARLWVIQALLAPEMKNDSKNISS